MNFLPFPKIETRRLTLNELSSNDAKEIYFLRSNKEVIKYVEHAKAETLKDASDFIIKIINGIAYNNWILWAIRKKGTKKLIGTICLWNFSKDKTTAEIGFVLHPNYQKKGIMMEAAKEVLQFGFSNLKLNVICGEVVNENLSSINLMKKFGFKIKSQSDNISIYSLQNSNSE